jgi:hypothetical protein
MANTDRQIFDGQIGQVDIDVEARQVAHKELDGRTALEGEGRLFGDEGQGADEQRHLASVGIKQRHADPPAR